MNLPALVRFSQQDAYTSLTILGCTVNCRFRFAGCPLIHCDNTSSVSDMLRSLDWRSLEQRRVDSRLTILYKIRNHLVAIDENSYLQRGTGRREYQYRQLRADKDYTRFSFFPRTVIQWNQLPSQICMAESLDSFKTQVSKIEHSRLN